MKRKWNRKALNLLQMQNCRLPNSEFRDYIWIVQTCYLLTLEILLFLVLTGEREGIRWSKEGYRSCPHVFRCVLASLYEGLSVRRLVGRSVGPSVRWSVGPSVLNAFFKMTETQASAYFWRPSISIWGFVCPSVHPSVCLPVCLSICPSVHWSVCPFVWNGNWPKFNI